MGVALGCVGGEVVTKGIRGRWSQGGDYGMLSHEQYIYIALYTLYNQCTTPTQTPKHMCIHTHVHLHTPQHPSTQHNTTPT